MSLARHLEEGTQSRTAFACVKTAGVMEFAGGLHPEGSQGVKLSSSEASQITGRCLLHWAVALSSHYDNGVTVESGRRWCLSDRALLKVSRTYARASHTEPCKGLSA